MEDSKNILNEDEIIDNKFQDLITSYLNSNNIKKYDIITRAYNFAKEAHKGIRRRSGEPYILHPIAVAEIVLKEMGLDATAICAALLHDVVEDTEYTTKDIKAIFGNKISYIVDGLTKISTGMFGEDISVQTENFRKLLLTMSGDIRVILIKIADRLHNMRTLESMAPAKQIKISGETFYIYAPLAHRLGLFSIKTELEDLCFKYEHPKEYNKIFSLIEKTSKERNKIYENFAKPIIAKLDKMDIKYEIKERVKSIYSINKKMESKSIPFEEVYDLFAVRIIFETYPEVDEKKQCWDIYSAITDIYKIKPDRIRDWLSLPKSNGYQALHVTVMGPNGRWIEVQIRSRKMDNIAEKGFAAHWKYKDNTAEKDNELDKWLKTIQEVLSEPTPDSIDFLDTVKMNILSTEIFIFTPKGEIIKLPKGSSVIDFAYTIHSDIGDHSLGAKINHTLAPLSQKLNSGDQIEILTSDSQEPKEEWLNFAKTAKAKNMIQSAIRKRKRDIVGEGKKILESFFNDQEIDNSNYVAILSYYNIDKKEDLFYLLGNNDIKLPTKKEDFSKKNNKKNNLLVKYMKSAVKAMKRNNEQEAKFEEDSSEEKNNSSIKIDRKSIYKLCEKNNIRNFQVATCCNALPGDNVFGFVNKNEVVEIHKKSCNIGMKLKASYGNNIVITEWGDYKQYSFLTTIVFSGIDSIGILGKILIKIVEDSNINIQSVNVSTKDGIFEGTITMYVLSADEVNNICLKVSKVDGVNTIHRMM